MFYLNKENNISQKVIIVINIKKEDNTENTKLANIYKKTNICFIELSMLNIIAVEGSNVDNVDST
jgi:hypothetical protein